MQYSPSQLKERLLESIDSDNNVVDMPKLLEVITLLERYPITREILEETRIGRLVNDVRKKITNKQLGKRAKELVRSWQKVLIPESETTVNGEGINKGSVQGRLQAPNRPPISPAGAHIGKSASSADVNKLVSPNSVKSSLSQGQISNKHNAPSLPNVNNKLTFQQAAKRSNSSPQLASSAKRLCISPSVSSSRPGTPDSACSQGSRASSTVASSDITQHLSSSQKKAKPCPSDSSKLKRTRSSDSFSKKPPDTDLRIVQSTSNLPSQFKTSPGPNGMVVSRVQQNGEEILTPTHSIETKGLKTTIRFNKTSPPAPPINGVVETPKKRGRGRPPKVKPQTPGDQIKPQNGSVSSAKSLCDKRQVKLGIRTDLETPSRAVSLTPKVKSTAELMQQLQAKNNLSVGRDTVRQIKDNLIQKEADDDYQSIVPEGAKPRMHRKRGAKNDLIPPGTPVSKTEMVEKFLESSVSQVSPEDLSPLKYELPRTESPSASTSFEDNLDGNTESFVKNGNLNDQSATLSVDSKSVISEKGLKSELKPNANSEPVPGTSSEQDKPLTLEEIYSKYPPLDIENFALDDDSYEMPEPLEITDDDVSRLHTQRWTDMNGCYDSWGSWRDWTQTVSFQSYNSDPLHILPYVITDN
ncbi:mediator of RNA polymerase II transcription subunit 26-like [Mercenaria mercenaria]|uniref:mediator of RNA polymerase II transcription subunit 26-like n=1 Tax=Mercenaria mercenaria TaxID=6596 RepID=UPI001E1D5D0A|nr:mediator of RNA polymerase II transcription subunit 26-like [Mercenaria mercenaria]